MIKSYGIEKDSLLRSLGRIQDRSQRAQTRLTTGYKVNVASDSPRELARISELQAQIERATQTRTNLDRVKGEVDANEATLRSAVKILEDIKVTGTQGAGEFATTEQRKILAERVRSWHSELVRMANSNVSGRYQFSGDLDNVAPYQLDPNSSTGVVRLHNSPDTRLIEDVDGMRLSVSRRAQDIFDQRDSNDAVAPENVFNAVSQLAAALEADDSAGVEQGLDLLRQAADHLNIQLGSFGVIQNRVNAALEQTKKVELQATTTLAGIREADPAEAILDLQQAAISLNAALGAQSNVPRKSLFDYLG